MIPIVLTVDDVNVSGDTNKVDILGESAIMIRRYAAKNMTEIYCRRVFSFYDIVNSER